MNALAAGRAVWRLLFPESLRRRAQPALQAAVRRHVARRLPRGSTGSGPVRVVGLFSASHGIAAGAERTARALEALGAPVERIGVRESFDGSVRLSRPTPASAWIFHLNPPELPFALASLGADRIVGPRYGAWAWELPKAPASWLRDASLLDEVWAPSRYIEGALAGAAAPVRTVPHPMALADFEAVEPLARSCDFQAVALFDFNSSMARKNPHGAIAAFTRAFGEDPTARLTIKTQNGARFPTLFAALKAQAPANVELVDETWPFSRVMSLIAGADVLVSLHRAEGFGLTLAEAMAMGVPTLATAFSGNLDFMDETCALMVPAVQTPVEDPQGIYRGQTWAEPDLDAAARALTRLRVDASLGRRLAAAGRRQVAERLSPEAWLLTLPAALQAAVRRGVA
jgi:glycosyltransferase involved in cell wall biosynthesis